MFKIYNKKLIIQLFNEGVLSVATADWYASRGYYFLCEDGICVDIRREELL